MAMPFLSSTISFAISSTILRALKQAIEMRGIMTAYRAVFPLFFLGLTQKLAGVASPLSVALRRVSGLLRKSCSYRKM